MFWWKSLLSLSMEASQKKDKSWPNFLEKTESNNLFRITNIWVRFTMNDHSQQGRQAFKITTKEIEDCWAEAISLRDTFPTTLFIDRSIALLLFMNKIQ